MNRKDPNGRNLFGGGFLGLDNIGVFDRSRPLPVAGQLEQVLGVPGGSWGLLKVPGGFWRLLGVPGGY